MMDVISLSYDLFKTYVNNKKIRWQYVERAAWYEIFAYDSVIKYTTSLLLNPADAVGLTQAELEQAIADKGDFEENYKPSANRTLLSSPLAALSKFNGKMLVVADGAMDGYVEWSFATDVEINKVMPRPVGAVFGDHVTMEVWARPGVMGAEAVKVEDFGDGIFIAGGTGVEGHWYEGSGGGKIPSYCTVRCYYRKVSAAGERKLMVDAEFLI